MGPVDYQSWKEKVKKGSKFKCIKAVRMLEFLFVPPKEDRVEFNKDEIYSVVDYEGHLAIGMKNGVFSLPYEGGEITWKYISEYFILSG